MKEISLYIMVLFYVAAGVNHFLNPKFYLKIIPAYLPFHKAINYLSGAAEIFLGIFLLCTPFTKLAAWGIIALLVAIFPANIYHLMSWKPGDKISRRALLLRLPFQLLFIAWALWHAL